MDIKHKIVLPMTMDEEYENADVPMPVGPNDLEATIERLELRNEYLHKHIKKLEGELIKEREDHLKLQNKTLKMVEEYRNNGKL